MLFGSSSHSQPAQKDILFSSSGGKILFAEIHKSLTDESLYRGSVKFGSDNIPQNAYEIVTKMLTGQPYEKVQLDPIVTVDKTNIDKYYKAE